MYKNHSSNLGCVENRSVVNRLSLACCDVVDGVELVFSALA